MHKEPSIGHYRENRGNNKKHHVKTHEYERGISQAKCRQYLRGPGLVHIVDVHGFIIPVLNSFGGDHEDLQGIKECP